MSYEGGGVPVSELARLQKLDYLTVLPKFSAGLPTYLQFNLENKRFADVRVRQAMLYAIDRKAIIETVKQGAGELLNTLFPQDWARAKDLEPYDYNPDKAKQLLTDAGWDASQPVDFIYYYSDQMNVDTVTAIQSYLAAVGVNIQPRLLDPAAINQVYADGSFQMGFFAKAWGSIPRSARRWSSAAPSRSPWAIATPRSTNSSTRGWNPTTAQCAPRAIRRPRASSTRTCQRPGCGTRCGRWPSTTASSALPSTSRSSRS